MNVAVVLIAAASIAAILLRPRGLPEAVWAVSGACLLVLTRLLPLALAGAAVAKGVDVYLFLIGMMLLSELARREGVFDWLASLAATAAAGSPGKLFNLVYAVGTVVTVFLSNDATAVVLTPAVYAAVTRAKATPRPCLLICAFIANAASFVLPISNPANLVLYGSGLPPLIPWLRTFILPSVASVAVTWLALRWTCRAELQGELEPAAAREPLTARGRGAGLAIIVTGALLLTASALGRDLGAPTCICAIVAALAVTQVEKRRLGEIARGVSWSVIPLVAGLFVIVEALSRVGAERCLSNALRSVGPLTAAFGIAALANVMNNLPSGLLAAGALHAGSVSAQVHNAVLVGTDLGPNLSVTGSLASILWLIALRREGVHIDAWQFLKVGLIVMPPALFLATLGLLL